MYKKEDNESIKLANRMRENGFIFAHIPNGTYTKDRGTRHKNKRMGVSPGFPDYIVIKGKEIGFLELKTEKGTLQKDQKERGAILKETGSIYFVAYGLDDAIHKLSIRDANYNNDKRVQVLSGPPQPTLSVKF